MFCLLLDMWCLCCVSCFFVVYRLAVDVCLVVGCGSLFAVRCLLCVVCSWVLVVGCLLLAVVCCMLFIVCRCWLMVVGD